MNESTSDVANEESPDTKKYCLLDFRRNDNFDSIILRSFETYALMLDTPSFVPEKVLGKISNVVFKRLKKDLRAGNKAYRKMRRSEKRQARREKRKLRRKKLKAVFRRFKAPSKKKPSKKNKN